MSIDATCLNCDGKEFELREEHFSEWHPGIKWKVSAPAYVCIACGESFMTGDQMHELRKRVAEYCKNKEIE